MTAANRSVRLLSSERNSSKYQVNRWNLLPASLTHRGASYGNSNDDGQEIHIGLAS